jgi:hypothetical protein
MAKIKNIRANELVNGGTSEEIVYPITATKAVYDASTSESLNKILRKNSIINTSIEPTATETLITRNVQSAINSIPTENRVLGSNIKFFTGNTWEFRCFNSTSMADWSNIDAWVKPWQIDFNTIESWKSNLGKVAKGVDINYDVNSMFLEVEYVNLPDGGIKSTNLEIPIASLDNVGLLSTEFYAAINTSYDFLSGINKVPKLVINTSDFYSDSSMVGFTMHDFSVSTGIQSETSVAIPTVSKTSAGVVTSAMYNNWTDSIEQLSNKYNSLPIGLIDSLNIEATAMDVSLRYSTLDLADESAIVNKYTVNLPVAGATQAGIISSTDYTQFLDTVGSAYRLEYWRKQLPALLTGDTKFEAWQGGVRFNRSEVIVNSDSSEPTIKATSFEFPLASSSQGGILDAEYYNKFNKCAYFGPNDEIIPAYIVDKWNILAGEEGKFNDETGYFELNGITDIEYEEAMRIMALCDTTYITSNAKWRFSDVALYKHKVRTLFPISTFDVETAFMFYQQDPSYIALYVHINNTSNAESAFNSSTLKYVYGDVKLSDSISSSRVKNMIGRNVEIIKIKNLKVDADFKYAKSLNYDSMKYLIDEATNTSTITITVHQDVYDKLIGDTSNDVVANLSADEQLKWQALIVLAESKNIVFAVSTTNDKIV